MRLFWFLLLVSACAPYVPENHGGQTRVAALEAHQLTLYLEHLGTQHGHHVFDLEVINQSTTPIEFFPGRIRAYSDSRPIHHERGPDINRPGLPLHMAARSPDFILNFYQQRERTRQTMAVIFSVLSVGVMVYDAVEDNKDARKTVVTESDVNRAVQRDAAVVASVAVADAAGHSAQAMAQENYFLPREVFPDVLLPAGERQRGKIFVPSEINMRYLRLVVPIGRVEYVFDFKRRTNS